MRIHSDNAGYLEFQRSKKPHHIHVIVAARSKDDPLKLLVNSAEIPLAKLIEGVKSVLGPLMLDDNAFFDKEEEKDITNNDI